MGVFYLISYIIDPYILADHFESLENMELSRLSFVITVIIVIDLILKIFTAVRKEDQPIIYDDFSNKMATLERTNMHRIPAETQANGRLEHRTLERNICVIFGKYMKREGFFDILANIPIILYVFIVGYPTTIEEIREYSQSTWFTLFMTLKIFRLLHVYNVVNTLKYVWNMAAEIFFMHRYKFVNFLSWDLAALKFLLALHYFACGWIWIYKYKFK